MLLVRIVGVSLLCSMSMLVNNQILIWYYCVPIYVIRTAIMNSTYPLEESVIMDFVPKNTRSRWKSLDSVATFGWCGSAAVGGLLADKYSYSFTFFITAFLQGLGGLLLIFLLPLVPINENFKKENKDDKNKTTNGGGDYVLINGASPSLNSNSKSPSSPRMRVYEHSRGNKGKRTARQASGSFDDINYQRLNDESSV